MIEFHEVSEQWKNHDSTKNLLDSIRKVVKSFAKPVNKSITVIGSEETGQVELITLDLRFESDYLHEINVFTLKFKNNHIEIISDEIFWEISNINEIESALLSILSDFEIESIYNEFNIKSTSIIEENIVKVDRLKREPIIGNRVARKQNDPISPLSTKWRKGRSVKYRPTASYRKKDDTEGLNLSGEILIKQDGKVIGKIHLENLQKLNLRLQKDNSFLRGNYKRRGKL